MHNGRLLFCVTDGGMVGEPSGAVLHETNKVTSVGKIDCKRS